MNEIDDATLNITDDNVDPEKGLKSEEGLSQKYFNYNKGNVKLVKLNVEKKKKSQVIKINKPLVLNF
jgi:hypothetical protein